MDSYDVIVIGYGPVGQMAAAQLGQAGHKVAAFERHAAMYGLSRAGHVDDEIMRTFDRVGAGEEFREDAVAWQLYDMRTKPFGGDLLMSLDWSVSDPTDTARTGSSTRTTSSWRSTARSRRPGTRTSDSATRSSTSSRTTTASPSRSETATPTRSSPRERST